MGLDTLLRRKAFEAVIALILGCIEGIIRRYEGITTVREFGDFSLLAGFLLFLLRDGEI